MSKDLDAEAAKRAGSAAQPHPTPANSVPVWDMVIADMRARDKVGRNRYGTPLQVDNGRDPLWDAYEELLDACVYLRQEIARRDAAKADDDDDSDDDPDGTALYGETSQNTQSWDA